MRTARRSARTPVGEALTEFILTMFRVNNRTLTWGDRLTAPFGLTSARWQILGAIVFADRPQPVAWLARDLGANRQNVQRIVNELAKDGIVSFEPNPHHRRAQLVTLTKEGRRIYDAVVSSYDERLHELTEGMSLSDIKAAGRVMSKLRARFEDLDEHGGRSR